MFFNSKINPEDPVDSGWNLSDLAFQTVRFPTGILYLPDHDVFLFKMYHSHSPQCSSFYSSSFFFFYFGLHLHITIQVMGIAAEAQFHVLAVDDSLTDRMLIERLLKTSSFHGNYFLFFLWFVVHLVFMLYFWRGDLLLPNLISNSLCYVLKLQLLQWTQEVRLWNFLDWLKVSRGMKNLLLLLQKLIRFSSLCLFFQTFSFLCEVWVNLWSNSFHLFLQDVEVNLIITDYCMPGMTGYDLLRKIKVSLWDSFQDF